MERFLKCEISVLNPGNSQEEMASLLCSQMKMGADLIKSFSVRMTIGWVWGLPQKEASPGGPVSHLASGALEMTLISPSESHCGKQRVCRMGW